MFPHEGGQKRLVRDTKGHIEQQREGWLEGRE